MMVKLGRNSTVGRKFYGRAGGGQDKENFSSSLIFLSYKNLFFRKVGGGGGAHAHQPNSSYGSEEYAMGRNLSKFLKIFDDVIFNSIL